MLRKQTNQQIQSSCETRNLGANSDMRPRAIESFHSFAYPALTMRSCDQASLSQDNPSTMYFEQNPLKNSNIERVGNPQPTTTTASYITGSRCCSIQSGSNQSLAGRVTQNLDLRQIIPNIVVQFGLEMFYTRQKCTVNKKRWATQRNRPQNRTAELLKAGQVLIEKERNWKGRPEKKHILKRQPDTTNMLTFITVVIHKNDFLQQVRRWSVRV